MTRVARYARNSSDTSVTLRSKTSCASVPNLPPAKAELS
ncbi:UNVERIFIED_ORG: hypothetical protein QE446_001536 [Rhizobium sp. SORGH_AS260]|nr:hypothetical protein [Rhizobium sp. SORGH_AS_0285]MDP9753679.1 hypothetical protein [Rhizobium sp. SORGH_AS_0260]MDR6080655.1 hypothetical protein [Agrobacterium sp. SORGH_AS_0440]